jgi:hypothetical protein
MLFQISPLTTALPGGCGPLGRHLRAAADPPPVQTQNAVKRKIANDTPRVSRDGRRLECWEQVSIPVAMAVVTFRPGGRGRR